MNTVLSFSHRLWPGRPAFTPGQAFQHSWDEACRPEPALQGSPFPGAALGPAGCGAVTPGCCCSLAQDRPWGCCKHNEFQSVDLFVYCFLPGILYFPCSPHFFPWISGTAWIGSWVLVSAVQVSCQSISNNSVSEVSVTDAHLCKEPWSAHGGWWGCQLRRSTSCQDLALRLCGQPMAAESGRASCWGQAAGFLQWRALYSAARFPQLFAESNLAELKVALQNFSSSALLSPSGEVLFGSCAHFSFGCVCRASSRWCVSNTSQQMGFLS